MSIALFPLTSHLSQEELLSCLKGYLPLAEAAVASEQHHRLEPDAKEKLVAAIELMLKLDALLSPANADAIASLEEVFGWAEKHLLPAVAKGESGKQG